MKHFGKALPIEIAWLLGSWAFSLLVLGRAIGYDKLLVDTLDIQLHNVYFVLSPFALSIPLLAVTIVLQTGFRLVYKPWRTSLSISFFGISLLLLLGICGVGIFWARQA